MPHRGDNLGNMLVSSGVTVWRHCTVLGYYHLHITHWTLPPDNTPMMVISHEVMHTLSPPVITPAHVILINVQYNGFSLKEETMQTTKLGETGDSCVQWQVLNRPFTKT